MEIRGEGFRLRPWAPGDEEALVRHAGDRRVWRNLTDRFPHPYTREAAQQWIASNQAREGLPHAFAIEVDGEAVGGVGAEPRDDLGRRTAEVGYWVGARYWGRGLATAATRRVTDYAFTHFDVVRLEASVIAWNPASARVLEKAGYVLEARLRERIFKDGEVADELLYAAWRRDWEARGGLRPA